MNARFFGESPQHIFNGASSLIDLSKSRGYATIDPITDVVFASITFAHPVAGSADLSGSTFPAGKTIFGVRSYQISSGSGVAYLSMAPGV